MPPGGQAGKTTGPLYVGITKGKVHPFEPLGIAV
jgi:hypothetical protein